MIQQIQISYNQFILMAKKTNRNWMWFVGATALWLGSYFVIRFIFKLENGNAGAFGDQFGAINALFTGLSFAGIIITLRQQQEELNAQRREFMTSRAMTIVYKQVELISNIVNNISYNPHPVQIKMWNFDNYHKYDINGIFAIKHFKSKISNSEDKLKIILEFKEIIYIVLNGVSNSVSLLIKTRINETMSDDDALFVFESFKYNIDHRVWDFIDTLRKVEWENKSDIFSEIKHDIQIISSFLIEMDLLNNKENKEKLC